MNTKNRQRFYELLVEGKFNPEKVIIREVPGALKRSPESEAWKMGVWTTFVKKLGFKPWPNDTKPSRWHLVRAYGENGNLVIEADPTASYFDCLGSRFDEYGERFGEEFVAVALSAAVAVVAKNKFGQDCLLVCLRSEKNDYKPGGVTLQAAGAISMKKQESPKDAALRELKEEAGIEAHELEDLQCICVAREVNLPDGGPVFLAKTSVPAEELMSRRHDEENETLFVPMDMLCQWVRDFAYAICECSIAAFLVVGKARHGDIWFEAMDSALSQRRALAPDEKTYKELEAQDEAGFARAFRWLKERS